VNWLINVKLITALYSILLYFLYHWPEDGPLKVETCGHIIGNIYTNCVDGILFPYYKTFPAILNPNGY